VSQSVVAASGNKIAASAFLGWSSFLLALYATITTPLALFNAFRGTQSLGNAKWVVLFVALPILDLFLLWPLARIETVQGASWSNRSGKREGSLDVWV
jgi:hypothetical protein